MDEGKDTLPGHRKQLRPGAQQYSDFLRSKSQLAGQYGFEPNWMPDFLFPFQRVPVEWAIRKGRGAIFAACGTGKALAVDQRILTDKGWQPIGSATVGTQVYGSDGRLHFVRGVYPQGVKQLARVCFSDGTTVVCDWDHLWYVRSQDQAYRGVPGCVRSTREIAARGIQFKGGQKKNFVPLVQPLQMNPRSHLIDPYTLGVVLGDGSITGGTYQVTCPDFSFFEKELPLPSTCRWVDVTRENRCKTFSIVGGEHRNSENPFTLEFRRLGLHGHRSEGKFVPREYLHSSPEMRLAVLQGLLDTDGYTNGPCIEYSTASPQLSDDVVFLARSLGGTATQSREPAHYTKDGVRVECLDKYRSMIKLPVGVSPFRLERKSAAYTPNQRKNPLKSIVDITDGGLGEAICIAVDAKDSLYVTEGVTLTHNTPMQLVVAENVVRHTNKPALIATPLGVSAQTVREAEKFGIDCQRSRDGKFTGKRVIVTNYERLHYFNPDAFSIVIPDEASAIKAFDGKLRKQVTRFLSKVHYRLLCTATPAPNDFIELGTASEALGELSQSEMLSTFFRSSDNMRHSLFKEGDFWNRAKWFFRPHSEVPFWRWVCSWARAFRGPEDLGFRDDRFILPPLNMQQHTLPSEYCWPGELFPRVARTLKEQRIERSMSLELRCAKVAELVNHDRPAVAWCQYNPEGDLLEKMIPGAVQVAGCDSDEEKEERLVAFALGQVRVLVTKPKIASWGLNWQHCGHQVFFPSHSWEQVHQAIHRSLRFGRVGPVDMDIVATEGEAGVMENLQKKQRKADEMLGALVQYMNEGSVIATEDRHTQKMEHPAWL